MFSQRDPAEDGSKQKKTSGRKLNSICYALVEKVVFIVTGCFRFFLRGRGLSRQVRLTGAPA